MSGWSDPRSSAVSDEELLLRHAEGDPRAFSELVARHRGRMWGVALRTLSDPEEAADALQDAFLTAGRYSGHEAVSTWLHRPVSSAPAPVSPRPPSSCSSGATQASSQ
ncbi:hypothetical protein GWI34_18525 [Actinomadura sp. DSM 109109]|nr:hypothetical protein [Actinomadura lepetitiana]